MASLIRDVRRSAPPDATPASVRASLLVEGQRLPLVVEPLESDVDLAGWCSAQRRWLDERLLEHGAILFRGFSLPAIADFERAASAAAGDLFGGYGDLPRNAGGEKIYESTPYPADHMILWHNESAHLPSWPMRISFHCVIPAKVGGCTPVIDTRSLMHQLDPAVVDAFRARGLLYVRNFPEGVTPTWQEFFRTDDRTVVEAMCRDAGSDFEWRRGGLRLQNRTRGVARHPVSGEDVFFNQVLHHHIACIDEDTREGLRALFDDEDLPRNVYYGDGTPIPDSVMAHIASVYERVTVRFQWRRGDMIMLDNMLTSHARDPFEGPRHIVVAMAQMISADRLPA
ncbi:MAG: TauD/TfdA family dioxygenase [Vulcanimicrobiaceae bacterium]